jgi:Uncharacterised protein family (UPF0236)
MHLEPVPSAIVARLLEAAKELEEWAVEHRQASLSEHEQGVLRIFRRVMGPALGAVLERARGLDHPAAQWQRAACPECGTRRRPHQWRKRQPVSVCGDTPFQRPYYWCPVSERGWVPADEVLGLGAHQILSAELQAWVAKTGAELPFEQAAEQLERLAGIGLGTETVRTQAKQVGTALAERQRTAATTVAQTHEAAEPLDPAPELLVVEVDGVQVRFQDGWARGQGRRVRGLPGGERTAGHGPGSALAGACGAQLCGQPRPSRRVRPALPGHTPGLLDPCASWVASRTAAVLRQGFVLRDKPYGFYWDYQQRTRSFYVGKTLPAGVELIPGADQAPSITAVEGGDAQT